MKFFGQSICLDGEFDENGENERHHDHENVKTLKVTPFDLLLLLISLFLFCVSAIDIENTGLFAAVICAPLYAVFSYRIGNHFSFLIPIIAYIISFAVTKDSVAPAIIIYVAGTSFSILNGIYTAPDRAKSSAVAGSVFSAGLAFFAALIAAKLQYGIDPAQLVDSFQNYIAELKAYSIEVMANTDLSAFGYAIPVESAQLTATAEQMFDIMIYLLPLYVLMAPMYLGYISASLVRVISNLCGANNMLFGINYEIRLSNVSVAVYIICSLLTIFMTGPVALSLSCILELLRPALFLCGIKQIKGFFALRKHSKAGVFFLTLISVIVLFILPMGIGGTVISLLGLFYCTAYRIQQLKQ